MDQPATRMLPTAPRIAELGAAIQLVLDIDDLDQALPQALNLLGRETGVHRLKIFAPGRDSASQGMHTLTHEWWTDGLRPQSSYGLTEFPDDAIRDYIRRGRDGQQSWETIDTVPTWLREPFERVGMRSMGLIPLISFGRYGGLLALDDCERRRTTPMVDMDAFAIFGRTIGAALDRERTRKLTANALHPAACDELVTLGAPDIDRLMRDGIAGEIHDGIAQAFVAILLQARAAGSACSTDDAGAVSALSRIQALATDGLADSRRVTSALRAAAVDRSGLLRALSDLADRCTITGQTECRFRAEGELVSVPKDLEHCIYRIAQEGIQNALRHASARTVDVELLGAENSLILIVEDDGTGIPHTPDIEPEIVVPQSISERAMRSGGTAHVEPRRPTGTRVRVEFPLSPVASKPDSA